MKQIPPTFAPGANALFCGDVVTVKRAYMFDRAAGDYLYLIHDMEPGLATLAYGADLVNGNTDNNHEARTRPMGQRHVDRSRGRLFQRLFLRGLIQDRRRPQRRRPAR